MTYLPPEPQQPAPQGGQPMPPIVPPPNSNPPGQPPLQPTGAPARGGLPVWAWVIIGVAAAIVLALIVASAIVIPRLASSLSQRVITHPTAEMPLPSEPWPDDLADGVLYTLDDQVPLEAGPFWSVPFSPNWEIDVFDVDGVNQLSNPVNGCVLYTYQGTGLPPEDSGASDRAATQAALPAAVQSGLPFDAAANPEMRPDGTEDVDLDFGPDEVEMMQLRTVYTTVGGESRERVMLLRAFLPSANVLLAQIDCPSGTDDIDDQFDEFAITQH